MKKSQLIKALLVVFVVLFASLTTARAHQLWTESQATTALHSARSTASIAIGQAQLAGLLPSELEPSLVEKNVLDSRKPPSGGTFWESRLTAFDDAQTRAYRVLLRHIRQAVRETTALTKAKAIASLQDLRTTMNRAAALGLDSRASDVLLRQQTYRMSLTSSPANFRHISAIVVSENSLLTSKVNAKNHYVRAEVANNGGSAAGVTQNADAEVASVQDKLSLLAIFTSRAALDRRSLASLNSRVHKQTSAFLAAVNEYDLSAQIDRITADYHKTIPSKLIVVSKEAQWTHVYDNGREVYNSPVTTGGPELPTDKGIFHIYMKASPFTFHSPWPPESPYYYPPTPISFWMPFDGAEGLHDASWRSNFGPGSNFAPTDLGTGNTILGTHGCVNLPYDAAQFVWDWAPIGTTVVVT
ncbi:MAG: hypothetical protein NVSMB52_00710 [Chloroflexota bacterium]